MIPVIIISGYLGAGKTTLIRDFLTDPKGLRATVLVNDFGQINLDAELIAETGADTIALTNGCACCSIGDDLLGATQTAAANAPDLLVIEASGVAQPARLSRLLRGVAGTLPARCLTVVNLSRADRVATDKFVSRLFRQQIEQADALCLNRATQGKTSELQLELQGSRQTADLHGFLTDGARQGNNIPATEHDTHFSNVTFHPDPMPAHRVEAWLKHQAPSAHRAKGPLPVLHEDGQMSMAWLDLVQGSFTLRPTPDLPVQNKGRIVVITPS
ncbi:MAG: hypothetical protein MRY77_00095 [Rhodobacteraceae bacterium]|nr:hypothetical protein [Paracoccaceae bacterium]